MEKKSNKKADENDNKPAYKTIKFLGFELKYPEPRHKYICFVWWIFKQIISFYFMQRLGLF